MQSPVKDLRRPDFERPKLEMPEFEMPKIDLSNVEIPKVDVGKAIADAATAVGLSKPRRSRWPFVIGAGIIVAVAGWTAMNSSTVRDRLSQAKSWISERVADMRAGRVRGAGGLHRRRDEADRGLDRHDRRLRSDVARLPRRVRCVQGVARHERALDGGHHVAIANSARPSDRPGLPARAAQRWRSVAP